MNTQLIHFDTAKRELALASSIDEMKVIRDKAEALRKYIAQQGASLEMQNQCAEIKLRAERRAGEMLREMELQNGGDATKARLHHVTELPPKLEDLGISKIQSHRWQLEASVPEEEFERHIAVIKDKQEELTSAGMRRLAIKLRGEDIDIPPLPEGLYNVIYADPPWRYDNVGVDGYLFGEPIQIKYDGTIAKTGNIYHEVYEKTKGNILQNWRASPHNVRIYIFVTEGIAYKINTNILAETEKGLPLIQISGTSMGFLIPLDKIQDKEVKINYGL